MARSALSRVNNFQTHLCHRPTDQLPAQQVSSISPPLTSSSEPPLPPVALQVRHFLDRRRSRHGCPLQLAPVSRNNVCIFCLGLLCCFAQATSSCLRKNTKGKLRKKKFLCDKIISGAKFFNLYNWQFRRKQKSKLNSGTVTQNSQLLLWNSRLYLCIWLFSPPLWKLLESILELKCSHFHHDLPGVLCFFAHVTGSLRAPSWWRRTRAFRFWKLKALLREYLPFVSSLLSLELLVAAQLWKLIL